MTRSRISRRCACTPRCATAEGVLAAEQLAGHRSRAARSTAGWRAITRSGCSSPTTTTTPTSSSRWAAGLAVVAPGGHLPAAAQRARAHQRDRVRRLLAVSGRAAADARPTASPTSSPPRTRSAPGTRARSPRPPTSSRRCPRCTWPGPRGVRWRCGGCPRACGCARWRSLYPCMTALAVLATGNHYVLDVLAGLATLGSSDAYRGNHSPQNPTTSRGACHKLVTKSDTR